ncbi:MAG: FG-GAP repeat protein [Deltaproteobacteria bacterium]|nr:FG-GAP repeat protein [Deltaproteobacteria bacterium]
MENLIFGGGGGRERRRSATGDGEPRGSKAGVGLAGAGDVDGDGLDDLLVGAFSSNMAGSEAGAAYLLFGSGI